MGKILSWNHLTIPSPESPDPLFENLCFMYVFLAVLKMGSEQNLAKLLDIRQNLSAWKQPHFKLWILSMKNKGTFQNCDKCSRFSLSTINVNVCSIHSLFWVTFCCEIVIFLNLFIAFFSTPQFVLHVCSPLAHIQQRRTPKMAVDVFMILPDVSSWGSLLFFFFCTEKTFEEEGRDDDPWMRLPFTVAPDDWLVKGAAGSVFFWDCRFHRLETKRLHQAAQRATRWVKVHRAGD